VAAAVVSWAAAILVFLVSALCRNLGRNQGWLTGRERDVLNGLLSGQSNKEIARKHGLSEVTIKHHLKSLRSKLGARNRTHAVCRAIELGVAEDSQVVA
jgi:DNA-binding NarL/FixJ family response regulator